jgi:hypothetical protein
MLAGLLDPARLTTFPSPGEVVAPDTTLVQVVWELAGVRGEQLLPPALHPTQPMLVSVLAFGGHAQLRLSCRHGARARAMVIAAPDDVTFDGEVLHVGGAVVRLIDPTRELGLGDMQFVASLWPVQVEGRGLRLVQQEIEMDVRSLRRHHAVVEQWPGEWPAPTTLVGAGVARGDVHLPAPRFMSRADVLAHEGGERVV